MKTCIFDTETTGLNMYAEIIECCVYKDDVNIDNPIDVDKIKTGLYGHSLKKLPAVITELTGITDEDLFEKPTFKQADDDIKNIIQSSIDDDTIFIAHNINFDGRMMHYAGYDINIDNCICTYKVACALYQDETTCKLEVMAEKYLKEILMDRYGLSEQTHRAEDDVCMTYELFGMEYKTIEMLLKNAGLPHAQEDILKKMNEITKNPLIYKTMSFGKYKGETLLNIMKQDDWYAKWAINNSYQSCPSLLNKDMDVGFLKSIYTIAKHEDKKTLKERSKGGVVRPGLVDKYNLEKYVPIFSDYELSFTVPEGLKFSLVNKGMDVIYLLGDENSPVTSFIRSAYPNSDIVFYKDLQMMIMDIEKLPMGEKKKRRTRSRKQTTIVLSSDASSLFGADMGDIMKHIEEIVDEMGMVYVLKGK